jgi:hypothetical protein
MLCSDQGPVTAKTSNEPAFRRLLAKSLSVAFSTSAAIMPDGKVARLNLRKLLIDPETREPLNK